MRHLLLAGVAFAALLGVSPHARADVVKIAYIDPLSGAFADVGDNGLKHFQYFADKINKAGGVAGGKTIEIIGLDNMTTPKESLIAFEKALDQGVQYITQGNGSSVASALIDAVEKHNARNPDKRVLFLNYAAIDPAFTNDKCSFWHFRFDADSDMKMNAVTDWFKGQPALKKVYVIGQDYSFGKAVQAAANRMLKEKRPDIEIVGDELHPLGKVKDFSPYIAKIKASGAQAVITGNWGSDLSLLVKASADAGFQAPFITYFAGGLGTPTAIGKSGVGLVKQISEYHANLDVPALQPIIDDFAAKTNYDFYYYRVKNELEMLKRAMDEAKSTDPMKVALALEGMTFKNEIGTVTMRKDNHQILQDLFISTFADDVKNKLEKTPYGFKTDSKIDAASTATPTTCKMNRPVS